MGKVFISHDSPEHSERVLALSNRLRAVGVDAELDRYHVRPPHGWPHWCEEQLRPEVSDFVLVVCTPVYRARVENRAGAEEGRGVYWEGAIVYNYLYNAKANARFIPVLLDADPESGVPMPLDGHTRYRLRTFELSDPGFAALYRELTAQPEIPKPALGDLVRLDFRSAIHVAGALPVKMAETEFPSPHDADNGETAAHEPDPDGAGMAATAASRAGLWRPFSDEASVARGEVRFWAIFETVLAVTVFWWVAIRYETFMLLTTSLFVAPLLLLRSEESTRLGVKWIEEGIFSQNFIVNIECPKSEDRVTQQWRWIGVAIGIGLGVGLGYPAAQHFPVGNFGWDAFGRALLIYPATAWIAAAAAEAVAIVLVIAQVGAKEGAVIVGGAGMAARAAAGIGAAAGAGAISGAALGAFAGAEVVMALGARAAAAAGAAIWGAGAGAIGGVAGAVAGARMGAGMRAKAIKGAAVGVAGGALVGAVTEVGTGAAPVAAAAVVMAMVMAGAGKELIQGFLFVPGVFLGVWFATVVIRIGATAKYLTAGYRNVSSNVRGLARCMAPFQQPELLPGLSGESPIPF